MADLFEDDAKPIGEKAIAVQATREVDPILADAMSNGNLDMLKEYLALKRSEEDRQARIEFEKHFTAMRAELPAIVKDKAAMNKGERMYNYAPLESIQRKCDPIIFKHGFCYSWREEAMPEGVKRIWLDISGYGHTRSNYFDCAKIGGTPIQNAIQIAGAMSTYGRRYSFLAGFGVIVEGEDSDGQIPDDVKELKAELGMLCSELASDGKFKLPTNMLTVIRSQLDKPDDAQDAKILRMMVKKAREQGALVK